MELKEKSKEELDALFDGAQAQITELQKLQTEIAVERRRRRFEGVLTVKRAELAELEKQLKETESAAGRP